MVWLPSICDADRRNMEAQSMLRTTYLIFTMTLISVTCISGLSSSAGPSELPVVKSTPAQNKAAPKSLGVLSSETELSLLGLGSDEAYALNSMAIPYIKDPEIRKSFARFYWCGTPTINYRMTHGTPSEQLLMKRAARIEARWLSGD
jgi:hypothetical protein